MEACGVWLDAAALKKRKVQVGRWGTRGWVRELGACRLEKRGVWGDREVMEAKSGTRKEQLWDVIGERESEKG